MEQMTRVALIPAYAPGSELAPLAAALREAGLGVVVVDDGSGARFDEVFKSCEASAEVIRYPKNGGKGHALKVGLRHIQNVVPAPFAVVTLDADGQHSVKDALRALSAAEERPGELVLGSRKFDGSVPLRSRFGNAVTRFVFRLMTGARVRDTQTGLRAFQSDLGDFMLNIPGERYEYEMNVLLTCARDKVNIREIDIETIYIDNNASSHFNTLRDSARIYKAILNFRKGVK
jgi:glycosyltransferase involved in cell wall biosynthesis